MYNKDKMLLWRRLLLGAAVCTTFCMTALSPSRAAVCLLSEGKLSCEGDPIGYTSVDEEKNFNCHLAGFTIPGQPGVDQEFYKEGNTGYGEFEGSSCKGVCGHVKDPAAAAKAQDWPSDYQIGRTSKHNNASKFECVVCHDGDKVIQQGNTYYWSCKSIDAKCSPDCDESVAGLVDKTSSSEAKKAEAQAKADFETTMITDTRSRESIIATLQEVCHALNYENYEVNGDMVMHTFEYKVDTAYDSRYVCGKCAETVVTRGCPEGSTRESRGKPTPAQCYTDCTKVGQFDYSENGVTKTEICCQYDKITECSGNECVKGVVATYDNNNPQATNAACEGWGWNDENASQAPDEGICSCYEKPCVSGSSIIEDGEQVQGPNAQGYFWVKKEGKCFAKIFKSWQGNNACYAEVEMSQETGSPFKCVDSEFDEENCQCMPLECPAGWSMYAHSVDANGTMYNEKIGTFLLESNGASLTAEAAAANCGDGTGKSAGWTVQTTEDGTPEGRTFFSIVEGEARNPDGTLKTHQCGKCVKKPCGTVLAKDYVNENCEVGETEMRATTTADNCIVASDAYLNDFKVVRPVDGMFSGDEQCYYCPYCFFDEQETQDCAENIRARGLMPCIGEGVSVPKDKNGNEIEGIEACWCDKTKYYPYCDTSFSREACGYDGEKWDQSDKYLTSIRMDYSSPVIEKNDAHVINVVDVENRFSGFESPVHNAMTTFSGYYVVNGICPLSDPYPEGQVGVRIAKCTGEAPLKPELKGRVTCYGNDKLWLKVDKKNDDEFKTEYSHGPVAQPKTEPIECGGFTYYEKEDCAQCEAVENDDDYGCPNMEFSHEEDTQEIFNRHNYYWAQRLSKDKIFENFGRNSRGEYAFTTVINGDDTGYFADKAKCTYGERGGGIYYSTSCTAKSTCDGTPGPAWNTQTDEPMVVCKSEEVGSMLEGREDLGPVKCGGETYWDKCETPCADATPANYCPKVGDFISGAPSGSISETIGTDEYWYAVSEQCHFSKDGETKYRYNLKHCFATDNMELDCAGNKAPLAGKDPNKYDPFWSKEAADAANCKNVTKCGTRWYGTQCNKRCEGICKGTKKSGYCAPEECLQQVCTQAYQPDPDSVPAECEQDQYDYYYCPEGTRVQCLYRVCNGATPTNTAGLKKVGEYWFTTDPYAQVECPEEEIYCSLGSADNRCRVVELQEGEEPVYLDGVDATKHPGFEYNTTNKGWYFVKPKCEGNDRVWYVAPCVGSTEYDCSGQKKPTYEHDAFADCQEEGAVYVGTPYACGSHLFTHKCSVRCTGCFTEADCAKIGGTIGTYDNANFSPKRGTCVVDGVEYSLSGDYSYIWNTINDVRDCVDRGWCKVQ